MNLYLAAEIAVHIQQERQEDARRSRLAASTEARPAIGSLVERIRAAFRPAREPCLTT
jgi:hypothetical protein